MPSGDRTWGQSRGQSDQTWVETLVATTLRTVSLSDCGPRGAHYGSKDAAPSPVWGGIGSSEEESPGVWVCADMCAYWVYACWHVCACVCSYTDIHVGGWVAYAWQVAAGLRGSG